MSALVARRPHPGTISARKPGDLRTELDKAIVPVSDADRTRVTGLVEKHCTEQAPQMLAMLGLAVIS